MIKFNCTLILLIVLTTITKAQNAEEILSKYTEISGGQENWEKVTSMKITGTAKLVSQGMELPFTRIMEKNGKQKTSLQVNGMEYIAIASDGDQVWGSNTELQPELKGKDEAENTRRTINDFPYPGFNWKERSYKAEFVGKEMVDSVEAYKVKLTKFLQLVNGEEQENLLFLYFDTDKYLPILTASKVVSGMNKGKWMKSYLSDYKSIDGYWYPFKTIMKYDDQVFQILESETVEWNVEIDQHLYKIPE